MVSDNKGETAYQSTFDLRVLSKGFIGVGAQKLVSGLLAVVVTLILARILGPAGFGKYAFYYAVTAVVTLPVLQGIPVLVLREVAREIGIARGKAAAGLLRMADKLVVSASGIFLVGGSAALLIARDANREIDPLLMFSAFGLQVIIVSTLVRSAIVRAYGMANRGQIPEMIVRPMAFVLLVLFTTVVFNMDPGTAMFLHFLAATTALGFAHRVLFRVGVSELHSAHTAVPVSKYLKPMFALSSVAGIQILNVQIAPIVIGILSTESEVGLFRVAAALALQISFLYTVVGLVIAPLGARMFKGGQFEELKKLDRLGAAASTALGALLFMIYWLAGEWLIAWAIGDAYRPAFGPLMVLSFAHLITLPIGINLVMLNMMRQENDVMKAGIVSVIVTIIGCVVVVEEHGALGAAYASGVGLLVWRGMLGWMVKARLKEASGIGNAS